MYRQFLRYGHQAVSHRFPQKHVLQKVLRRRFECSETVDDEKVRNTLQFFRAAAESNGLERRCVLTLLHYYASQHKQYRSRKKTEKELEFNESFMQAVIQGINDTQHMCL